METSNDNPVSPPASVPAGKTRRRPRKLVIALGAVLAILCLATAAFFAYFGTYYHDADAQHANLTSTADVPVAQGDGYLAFGDPASSAGIVFYPGAKVEYSAYAPLMRHFAEHGYLAVVVEMPFNFALFDTNAADRVRTAFPQVTSWWIGGHSLGGSMAAQYAADHAADNALAGTVLLGAYSAADLSQTNLGAIVVYGSNDLVLNRSKLETGEALLPAGAVTLKLDGGNHAGFGNYGAQDGDGEAQISPEQQQKQTADAVDEYIRSRG